MSETISDWPVNGRRDLVLRTASHDDPTDIEGGHGAHAPGSGRGGLPFGFRPLRQIGQDGARFLDRETMPGGDLRQDVLIGDVAALVEVHVHQGGREVVLRSAVAGMPQQRMGVDGPITEALYAEIQIETGAARLGFGTSERSREI